MRKEATKICSDCGRELPLSEFVTNMGMSQNRHGYCRECASKKNKEAKLRKRKMYGEKPWYLR